ncbi:hypothetical protein IWX47DRAFT_23925 [Phyllosticta citricarpa]
MVLMPGCCNPIALPSASPRVARKRERVFKRSSTTAALLLSGARQSWLSACCPLASTSPLVDKLWERPFRSALSMSLPTSLTRRAAPPPPYHPSTVLAACLPVCQPASQPALPALVREPSLAAGLPACLPACGAAHARPQVLPFFHSLVWLSAR